MVWRGIHESPGFAMLAESLERHVGQAAAATMRVPFGLSNADELKALVRAAGFQNVSILQREGTVRFPSVERFVSSYVADSPLVGLVSKADDAAREALITDVQKVLKKIHKQYRVGISDSCPPAKRKSVGPRVRP
jgi:hypothetical protein